MPLAFSTCPTSRLVLQLYPAPAPKPEKQGRLELVKSLGCFRASRSAFGIDTLQTAAFRAYSPQFVYPFRQLWGSSERQKGKTYTPSNILGTSSEHQRGKSRTPSNIYGRPASTKVMPARPAYERTKTWKAAHWLFSYGIMEN